MGSVKYKAKVGLEFKREGKLDLRVEPGELVPATVSEQDITDLLAIYAIEPVEKKKESK